MDVESKDRVQGRPRLPPNLEISRKNISAAGHCIYSDTEKLESRLLACPICSFSEHNAACRFQTSVGVIAGKSMAGTTCSLQRLSY